MVDQSETTDLTLFIRTSGEEIAPWNRQRIVDALLREADIDYLLAAEISKDVEKQIVASGIGLLTTSLVRELVNAKLIERGLEKERRLHGRLGFPLYDVRQLILHQNKENANTPHSPEGTNLLFAEGIKKEFSLYDVFSIDIGEAHTAGDLHIHGLGYIDRPYSCCQSLEYLKLFGLKLPHAINSAKPAKHAEVLLAHMVRFSAVLQGHFTGTIGWDALNISFAPYLRGKSDKEIRQFAQMLVYEFSQLSATRGGQALYTDIHLYYDMPQTWADLPAIGPMGKPTGETYRDYTPEAQRFAYAIFEVFKKGDAAGRPFILPRPLLHISEAFFHEPRADELLRHACDVAGAQGNTCFVFDRAAAALATGCFNNVFLPEASARGELAKPWLMRQAAVQSVTLNMPRLGYKAQGDETKLFNDLSELMARAAKAHIQKKDFLEKLLSYAEQGPLAVLAMNADGSPFLRMNRSYYIIGLVGLNELVRIFQGSELHQSQDAMAFGLRVVGFMQKEADHLSEALGVKFVLEQTPAETTAYRFARLDLKHYSPAAGRFVQGDIASGAIYYTNSTHLNVAANIAPLQRVIEEGKFHQFMAGEVITHLQLGDADPGPEALARFVRSVFDRSDNRQMDFTPEFTSCLSCGKTARGLDEKCFYCGSSDVEGIAQLTKYYSKISGWNKGKLAELRNRMINSDF
ncbi:MAG: anaerobic ribonucleoside-triphosphate reductase [Deltaproteobacteria bacterium HGW-Deltaproteobacteria-6]|jgi:ribonucleoside-triphosphate reductase|nr:MAG: anaerobic ribonucleoside-triphosphate reductase [Deltaproteobacteria bacterium HGW-Deltaproteobacteria-6]